MTIYANVGHILLKRGNTTQSAAYTGPAGEVTYDTGLRTLRVHDGSTAGGNVILINQNNVSSLSSTGNLRLTANTAGAAQQWTFGANGNLTLSKGGTISEGGGISGAIRLTPAGGANSNQALLIYPTAAEGDHIHLTSGGGTTELYLGDDSHYVRLVDGGNVEIRATTANASSTAAWNFSTNGNLSAPGNISAAGTITASSISVTSVVQYANLTTSQITAISPTSRGMTVFNYTTGNIQVYNGTKWANLTLS